MTNSYLDNRSAQLEKRARIDILDLKDQREGEAHIFFKSNIIRARMFYSNPPPAKRMKLNQFLKVAKPSEKELITLYDRYAQFSDAIKHPEYLIKQTPIMPEDLIFVANALKVAENLSPLERALAVFAEYYRHENAGFEETPTIGEAAEVEPEAVRGMDIFTQPTFELPENLEEFDPFSLLSSNFFSTPLLDKTEVQKNLERIERLLGKSKGDSHNTIAKLIADVRTATYYPPPNIPKPNAEEVASTIDALIASLEKPKSET